MAKRTQTNQPLSQTPKRRRVYAACTECRRRRRKCDGKEPCEQCESYGYQCAYSIMPHAHSAEPTESPPGHRRLPSTFRAVRDASQSAETTLMNAPPTRIIVNKERGRFINAHSAVALPHLAGREVAISEAPRLHSYAWNLGIRPERRGSVATSLSDYLTLPEGLALADKYFEAVHPLFPFLSEEHFLEDMRSRWNDLESRPNFAAAVAGVAALGSFFSPSPHPREEEIKGHGFSILDLAFSNPATMVDMDSVAGWILRTLFVRLTTRPAISCMASHASVHMAEILSLHRDVESASTTSTSGQSQFPRRFIELRRRYYWAARLLNQLLSLEYGLSPVQLAKADCPPPTSEMDHIVALSAILESSTDFGKPNTGVEEVHDLFARTDAVPASAPAVSLLKAEVCLSLLRRHLAAGSRPSRADRACCCKILNQALTSVHELVRARHTWWNILGVPFQIVCLAVAFDTSDFLALLPESMETLRMVTDSFDTHMSKEALHTAQQLIAASRDGTNAKLELQTSAMSHALPLSDSSWPPLDVNFDLLEGWPFELDIFPCDS